MYETVVALGLETTGLDAYKDRIVEVAAAVWVGGEVTARFHELVRPKGTLSLATRKLTGITPAMLEHARDADAVLADLLDFLPEAPCIAHNARFVRGFLRRATKEQFDRAPLDTLQLSRICFPSLPSYSLSSLREFLELPEPAAERRCPADCETVLHLWARLARRACELPGPVLAEINGLLAAFRRDPLRAFFKWAQSEARLRLDLGAAQSFAELFRKETPPAPRRYLPEPIDCRAIDADAAAELFGTDGPFAKTLDGYEHRQEQIAMTRGVVEAFNDSQHLLVEAGTGIGKSLAYLVPAVQWSTTNDTPVVVSTNTKNLQSQLYGKDLPLIRRALDAEFKAALIKGRRNYLCVRKLIYLLRNADVELERQERMRLLSVLPWAAETTTGDLSESAAWGGTGAQGLNPKLSSAAEECSGPDCRFRRQCFLHRARRRARAADVVVANHSVVFAEMETPDSSPVLPPYAHVIFDEAHNLEAAATSQFSVEVSQTRIGFALRRLWRPGRRGRATGLVPAVLRQVTSRSYSGDPELREQAERCGKAICGAVASIQPVMERFFAALGALLGAGGPREAARIYADRKRESLWRQIDEAKKALVSALARVMRPVEGLTEALRQMAPHALPNRDDFISQIAPQTGTLKEVIHDTEFVLAAENANYVFWVERAPPRQGGVRAWAAPVQVGRMLLEHVYGPKQTVIFTSATLTVRGSTAFLRKRLGIDLVDAERIAELNAGTPFDYRRQCLVMVPTFLSDPADRETDYPSELGVLLAEVFRRTGGRGMALFTSYEMLRRATGVLRDELLGDGIRILAQGLSGSRENITELFKRDLRSVLMGTHSFWEGVDLVGETLSCLVVARLPFAVYTDPIHQARCEQIEAEGGDAFLGYSVPGAVIRFRQGFGRLIRHRTDRGIVIVTDRRIITKRYGDWFRRSLPAATQAFRDREEFLETIESFLEEEDG